MRANLVFYPYLLLSTLCLWLNIPCFESIQENISLFNAKKWLHAVVKGDSMLIIYKINVS